MKEQMAADAAAHYADLTDGDTDEEYAGVADSADDETEEDF